MKRTTRIAVVVMAIVSASTVARTAHADDAHPTTVDKARATPRVPPLRRVTLTLDMKQAISFSPLLAVTSELRVARRWSLAVSAGGGLRDNAMPGTGTNLAWQLGAEPRWYFSGEFNSGFYVAWSTSFADSVGARFGYESLAPPPGLSTGPSIGYKSVYVPIITPDVELGIVRSLITPSVEGPPPPVALMARLGIGFSL